jgi:uncharacterized Zn finger protein (UPF0148 family)
MNVMPERRKGFTCECGEGFMYAYDGWIVCTRCRKRIDPKREDDGERALKEKAKDWA